MANPACMSGDGKEAVFVGTMLQTGDAVALCDECLVAWSAAVLQAMTGVDPAPFIQAISEPAEAPQTKDGAPTDEPPAAAPADADEDAGYAAGWVLESEAAQTDTPDPKPARPNGGRSRNTHASVPAATGGNSHDD